MRRDASFAEGTATETDSNAIISTSSAELIDGSLRSSDLWCGYAESVAIVQASSAHIGMQK